MKAIIYLRVSTEGQVNEGVSLEAQEAKARAWCDLNDTEVKGVFVDAGVSGKRADNREGLQEALKACNKGDVLIVYSLSRLARSTKDTIEISELLQKKGVDLVSLSEKIDTTSAAGKMIFRLLAVMAEFERDQVSERTTVAMQHKKFKGERVGSIPYGYKLAADGKTLLQEDSEQAVIATILKLHKEGFSLNRIAKILTEEGLTTRSGKPFQAVQVQRVING